MLGLAHRVMFAMIEDAGGPDVLRAVLDRAEVPCDRHFRLDEDYSDSEWRHLLVLACETLEMSQPDVEARLAEHFMRDALARWPAFFDLASSARDFFLRIPAIHNGLRARAASETPRTRAREKFRVDGFDGFLITRYESPNRLCDLYLALARRVIAHYGEDATIEQTTCMKTGYPSCEFRISWDKLR